MNYKLILVLIFTIGFYSFSNCQENYSSNPLDSKFVTEDVDRFWLAFNKMDVTNSNPFQEYIEKGSNGLKGFIEDRIINADSLYNMVLSRKEDYLKSKNVLNALKSKRKRIRAIYAALKYWYPDAVFPPVYFVVGRFNSGGTVSETGIIIGTEMLKDLEGLSALVAHELIHFQQKSEEDLNLLSQSIMEGSADFIGELISGENINSTAFQYGEMHQEALCKEFVTLMKQKKYEDWLYGTSGKDERPNDLGYWMGYKITEAYFNKQKDKHQAIYSILYITDPYQFLKESGFLNKYIQ